MARYTGPVTRKSRRLGVDLVGGDQAFEKRPYPPGQHGRARIKESEYRQQLQEKQKARFTYGVMEKQFRRYYEEANRHAGKTGEALLQILETPAGQRRVPRRAGAHPPDGSPAGQPRPLHGQRRQGGRPQLPGVAVRHHRCQGEVAEHAAVPVVAGDRGRPPGSRLAAGRSGSVSASWCTSCPSAPRSTCRSAEQLIVEFYSK